MKVPLLLAGLIFPLSLLYAQECANGRYVDPVFLQVERTNAIAFGSNTGTDGSTQILYMDIYEPAGDQLQERPVVLVAFGGSFVSGSRQDVALLCEEFAKRGYVAVAPDYRVGFFLPNAVSTMLAVMKGTHDLKACVRYLRRSVAEDGNPWRIDQDRIIIGGVSAGAISALHATYLDDDQEMPPAIEALSDDIGGVEGLSGNEGYSSAVSACYSLSGMIGDTLWIDSDDPPLASVHEMNDQVVPYYTQPVSVVSIPTGLIASGSHDIHLRLEDLGVDHCLLTYPGNGHVGYLASDPVNSMGFVFEFCKNVVCEQEVYCGAITVGMDENEQRGAIDLYPNPATDVFQFEASANAFIQIIDLHGRQVWSGRIAQGINAVNVAHLPVGVYLVRTDAHGGPMQRLVITR